MNERQVIARLIDDRDAGFVALVQWSSPGLYRGLVRLVWNRQAAEDLLQDAYLRAWKALESYPDERIDQMRLHGWLWTIAMNRARSHLGAAYPPALRAEEVEDFSGAVADADECERLLGRLETAPRTAVVLRHIVGLSYQEIGDLLDLPVGTVKSDVHRAIKRLRATLEAES